MRLSNRWMVRCLSTRLFDYLNVSQIMQAGKSSLSPNKTRYREVREPTYTL